MLSSWQIAQQHGMQGQMFGAQQQYAQQLSAGMPAPYQGFGLGAQGFSGGFSGSGYSYGGAMSGSYGPGNSFGNSVVSGMGGIGNAFFGSMGAIGGIGGAALGFRAGGLRGAMMGGAVGFGAGSLIGMAGSHVTNSFMEGAHEQSAIERTLSQFQFQNQQSRTGRGFSRSDSMQIGNMVRQMERVPEMLTSFGELNKIMDKMGQMGLMQGVRDAGQFMDKFRATIHTLKDLSKMIGTTMEGALKAFGEARLSGFYSQGDIVKNVLNRQITGSLTGMTQEQVGALQQYGSQIGHAAGGSRRSGARNALRTAGQLGMANQMGILSNDMIVEMTGKEGSEGIQDLSAQMTQLGYRMGRSNVGQALTLALGEMEDGRYTGRMDENLVARVRSGELGLGELRRLARGKARGRRAKLSFAAHKERLRSEMVGAVGSEGIGMQLQEILGDRGWSNPDATNLVMQRFGASEEQANLLQKLLPSLDEIGMNMRHQGSAQARNSARQVIMKERYSMHAIKHKVFKKIEHKLTDPFKDAGTAVRDYITNAYEGFVDELTGQYTATLTKGTADLVRNSMMGSKYAQDRLRSMHSSVQASGGLSRGAHLGTRYGGATRLGGVARSTLNDLSGTTLSGDQLKAALKYLSADSVEDQGWSGERASDIQSTGRIVLSETYAGGTSSTSMADIKRAEREGTIGFRDSKGRQNWRNKFAGTESYERGVKALKNAIARGDIKGDTLSQMKSMSAAIKMGVGDKVYEEMMGKSSDAFVLSQFAGSEDMQGYYAMEGLEEKMRGLAKGFDLKDYKGAADRVTKSRKSLAKSFRVGEGMASFAEIDKAMSDDSTLRQLVLGSDSVAGLVDTGSINKNWDSTRGFGKLVEGLNAKNLTSRGVEGDRVRQALAKRPETWSKEEEAAAAKLGITKEYARENRDKLEKVRAAIDAQGGDVKKALKELGVGMQAQDMLQLERQFSELGGRMTDSLGRYKDTISGLGKGGAAAASALTALAKDLESGNGLQLAYSGELGNRVGNITEMIQKASPEDKKKLMNMIREGGFSEVEAAVGSWDQTMRKFKNGRKRKLTDFVSEDAFGTDDQGQAMFKSLKARFGDTIDEDEIGELAKELSTGKTAELMARGGSEQRSQYMSEQEIANSLKTMSDNTLKAAEILSKLSPTMEKPP